MHAKSQNHARIHFGCGSRTRVDLALRADRTFRFNVLVDGRLVGAFRQARSATAAWQPFDCRPAPAARRCAFSVPVTAGSGCTRLPCTGSLH